MFFTAQDPSAAPPSLLDPRSMFQRLVESIAFRKKKSAVLSGENPGPGCLAAACHCDGCRQVFAVGSEDCPGSDLNTEISSLMWFGLQLCWQEWNLITFEGNDLSFILFLKLDRLQVD